MGTSQKEEDITRLLLRENGSVVKGCTTKLVAMVLMATQAGSPLGTFRFRPVAIQQDDGCREKGVVIVFLVGKIFQEECTMSYARFLKLGLTVLLFATCIGNLLVGREQKILVSLNRANSINALSEMPDATPKARQPGLTETHSSVNHSR